MEKKLVVPGEILSDNPKMADEGTYVEDNKVFSSVFGIASLDNKIKVFPLAGKYIPKRGDIVVGLITEVTFSNWIVDIRSPYEGLLHISEFPRRINNTEMSRYLTVGDSILTLVKDVDSSMKVELTLNDQRLKRIKEGRVIEVTPSKVPRMIGRSGSMIAMLKSETNCSIKIGQNGRIWLSGKDKDIDLAVKAILKIERETHISGLTDRISNFLKEEKGEKPEVTRKETERIEEITKEEETVEEEKATSEEEETVEEEKATSEEEKTVEEEKATSEEEETVEEEKPGGILDELLGDDK